MKRYHFYEVEEIEKLKSDLEDYKTMFQWLKEDMGYKLYEKIKCRIIKEEVKELIYKGHYYGPSDLDKRILNNGETRDRQTHKRA